MTSDHAFGGSFIYINDSHQRAWTTAVNSGDGGRGWNDIVYAATAKAGSSIHPWASSTVSATKTWGLTGDTTEAGSGLA